MAFTHTFMFYSSCKDIEEKLVHLFDVFGNEDLPTFIKICFYIPSLSKHIALKKELGERGMNIYRVSE